MIQVFDYNARVTPYTRISPATNSVYQVAKRCVQMVSTQSDLSLIGQTSCILLLLLLIYNIRITIRLPTLYHIILLIFIIK